MCRSAALVAITNCPTSKIRVLTAFYAIVFYADLSVVCSTFLHPFGQLADCSTHVDEGVEVLVQALVSLPLQSGQCFEVGPVEGLPAVIVHNSVGRDGAVEVGLLSTRPPAAHRQLVVVLVVVKICSLDDYCKMHCMANI